MTLEHNFSIGSIRRTVRSMSLCSPGAPVPLSLVAAQAKVRATSCGISKFWGPTWSSRVQVITTLPCFLESMFHETSASWSSGFAATHTQTRGRHLYHIRLKTASWEVLQTHLKAWSHPSTVGLWVIFLKGCKLKGKENPNIQVSGLHLLTHHVFIV